MTDIYFDNSATTPVLECAADAMLRTARTEYGNPSSRHAFGQSAKQAEEKAASALRKALGVKDGRVVFCGSGTEANNLALMGRALSKDRYKRGKIIISDSEHPSVENTAERLETLGYKVARISTLHGRTDMEALQNELSEDTFFVSVMAANNETGAVYDTAKVAGLVHSMCPDAVFHTDATQAFMKIQSRSFSMGADMITVSGHKIGAPKGIGALWIHDRIIKARGISAVIYGGGQQEGLRSGTENMPGIAALGAACEYRAARLESDILQMASVRRCIVEQICTDEGLREVRINEPEECVPHILSLIMPNISSETMLNFLSKQGIYVSSGSACSSNSKLARASRSLLSYGLDEDTAQCVIRVSLSPENTADEAKKFCTALKLGVSTLIRRK